MSTNLITITAPAQAYLAELLKKQDTEGVSVRVFILDAGTPKAETCISFCRPGEEKEEDSIQQCEGFKAYIDEPSIPFLEEAVVDYSKDAMGGQLTIKAPNSRLPKITDESSLPDRINYVLYNEINPGLAAHGGNVTLEELYDENIAVLRFGGGCQGCQGVDYTMMSMVDNNIRESFPEITSVIDVTDHSYTENAYY